MAHATIGRTDAVGVVDVSTPARGHRGSVFVGVLAALGMAVFYAGVVWGASGSFTHLVRQVATDWYLLLPIVAGFGFQAGLVAELRRLRRMDRSAAAAGVAGGGASTVGMVACCAHHVADLLPLLGATAAASFLYDWRLAFMLAGLSLNGAGIAIAVRRLRGARAAHGPGQEEGEGCVAS